MFAIGELPPDIFIYSYRELREATKNFNDVPLACGGYNIGMGVYRAVIRDEEVAIKRLENPVGKQFINELQTLTKYKHENLLRLIGCCVGPPNCCIVYEYMPNGSLEDRLACKDQSEPLPWQTRLSIAYGSAKGINHLHTFGKQPMVHRDIKSSNILLDENFFPKLGDFGLVRTVSSGESSINAATDGQNIVGTCVYMPKEAWSGDVSVKWDTFSFGIILLELLTGLPPGEKLDASKFQEAHMENFELFMYDILPKLDAKASWNQEAAFKLYRIAQRCLVESKSSRPTISEILEDLKKLSLLR